MSTAPHPALRKLWIEAAAAGRAMREICLLQHAWDPVIDSALDLPIFYSDELVQPLIQFSAFEPPIDEALARLRAERDSHQSSEPTAIHQLYSPAGGVYSRREKAGLSLPSEVDPTPRKLAASNNPAASHQRKTETFSTVARLAESHKMGVADRPGRSEPGSLPETVSISDHKVRGDVREVERGIRNLASSDTSRSIPDTRALTREAFAKVVTNSASRPVDPVSVAPIEAAASSSSFKSIPHGEEPGRAPLDAETVRVTVSGDTAKHGNLFEQVLGAAVERLARSTRQRQAGEQLTSSETVSGEPELVLQRDPPQSRHYFPRTGLQRLAARALQSAGRPAEKIRSSRESEFASFLPATCFSSIESAEFASHLSTLLRQEMARHGIGLEDLEQ
jgi:hypothetical protein